jgi:hypothetical protein
MRPPSGHRAVFRYHPTFGYSFRDRVRVWQVPTDRSAPIHLIATNSVGARCIREPRERRSAAATRVLIVGCSSAAGDGVSNRDRFSEVLEGLVPGVEVHNYALSGSGHDQQLLVHREFADVIHPDVLLVCPSLACIGRNLLSERLHRDAMTGGSIRVPKPYFTLDEQGELVLHQVPVPKPSLRPVSDPRFTPRPVTFASRVRTFIRSAVGGRASSYRMPIYDDDRALGYRLGQALLRQMIKESHAQLKLVAPMPDLAYATEPDATNHHAFFRSVAAEAGADYVDVAKFFRPLPAAQTRACFFPHDGHYTRAGHEVIARGLAGALRSRGVVQ